MQRLIRHPAEIPIEVKVLGQANHENLKSINLSIGGLSFCSEQEFSAGDIVCIRIPISSPPFEIQARVIWCRLKKGRFVLGVAFLNAADAFRVRMVEQICHIENYREACYINQGRTLSSEDAAREWIRENAAKFPDAGRG